jgi:Carboxypeptidase regulatory-like domain
MSSTRILSLLALILLLIMILAPFHLAAQDSATGSLRGTVLDSTGGAIASAAIVVVSTATGTRYTAATDPEGGFAFELPPGDYSARVVAQGMSPQVTPQLHVDVGATSDLKFVLTIAGAHENVTVSAAPALVETQPSAVSTLLDERALSDLPLNGRRFSDLALFSPGVTQDPRSLTSSTNGDLSFGGIRGFQNTTLVDGLDYNNAFFSQARGRYRAPYQFSTEVVQEFRVSTNSYGAEQGRSGGAVVNVVTKSGSNHVHGTAFYYLRDSSFGASNPFLAFKPHNRQQQRPPPNPTSPQIHLLRVAVTKSHENWVVGCFGNSPLPRIVIPTGACPPAKGGASGVEEPAVCLQPLPRLKMIPKIPKIVYRTVHNFAPLLDLRSNPCNNYSVHPDGFGGVSVWQK